MFAYSRGCLRIAGLWLASVVAGCASTSAPALAPGTVPQLAASRVRPPSHATNCPSISCVYVTSWSPALYLFPFSSRHKTRAKLISGSSTGLVQPIGVALDADHNIYIADQALNEILVYAPGIIGNVRPIRTIVGDATTLNTPTGITLDGQGRLYVADEGLTGAHWNVAVFAAGASGNVAPTSVIVGSATQLRQPIDVQLGSDGSLYVENFAGSMGETINVYAAGASGNVAPLRSIGGSNSDIGRSESIAVDSSGKIYVAHTPNGGDPGAIVVFAAGASGNVAPVQTISGGLTMASPIGLTLADGNIYSLNGGDITVYPQTANGDVAPIQVIKTNPVLSEAQHILIR